MQAHNGLRDDIVAQGQRKLIQQHQKRKEVNMKTELLNHLSPYDLSELLTLSHQSLSCNDIQSFRSLVLKLKELIYFENSVCAYGNVLELFQEKQPKLEVCDICYPEGYMDLYLEEKFYSTDAVFFAFITQLSPVNWLSVEKNCDFSYPVSVKAVEFNMNDGWTHGILDPDTMNSTVFYFGGPTAERNIRTQKILEYIVPFLSEAYKRVLKKKQKSVFCLSEKEIEILNWLKEGKSSWEISLILNVSKRTIDFHVNNIKYKLGAYSRAQAVAVGLQYNLIYF